MIVTRVYEDNGGQLKVVVREDGVITNVIGGFEGCDLSTGEFADLASKGFPYFDEFDPDKWSGFSMSEAAKDVETSYWGEISDAEAALDLYPPEDCEAPDLIAIITERVVQLFPGRMGYAGRKRFSLLCERVGQ